jgi:tetratricopeptide (TPR) repeat protein
MKTLGLCMIVGAGEAQVLKRCLSSVDALNSFDQISICLTSGDQQVMEAALLYTDRIAEFQWITEEHPYGDFAGARNAALDLLETDYWMWLDADDVFSGSKEEIEKTFTDLRKVIQNGMFDIGVGIYALESSGDGKVAKSVLRERVVRSASGIRWIYPVHEQLTLDWAVHKKAMLGGKFIVRHKPEKPRESSIIRNIKILDHEFRSGRVSRHILFYLGAEYLNAGNTRGAIPFFTEVIRDFTNGDGSLTLVYEAAEALARLYIYQEQGRMGRIRRETYPIGERYARVAATVSDCHAEPHVFIGDCHLYRNELDAALSRYTIAEGKRHGAGGVQDSDYYAFIPAVRKSGIYLDREEYEQSLIYSKRALEFDPSNERMLMNRKRAICRLLEEVI